MGISPPTTPTPTQKKETKKEKRKSIDSIGPTIEPKISKVLPAKVSSNDPDKIACPICAKLWHKSNLRNHLFYGHHMKTSEVEAVLIRLKDPNSIAKQETTVNERTPCPLCDRSFKVFIAQPKIIYLYNDTLSTGTMLVAIFERGTGSRMMKRSE